MVNLESSQHYDDGYMKNPKDHPAERPEVPEEYICPRCEGRKNYDEEMCEGCRIDEEEKLGNL